MNNTIIEKDRISWKTKSKKHDHIHYEHEILKHSDHISVSKTMYVRGKYKRMDLAHIPFGLIDDIKNLVDTK